MRRSVASPVRPGEIRGPGNVPVVPGAREDAVEGLFKTGDFFGVFCDKEVIVLLAPVRTSSPPAEGAHPGRGPVGRSGSQIASVNGKGLKVHNVAGGIVLDQNGNMGSPPLCRKQKPGLVPPVVELGSVPVDSDPDASPGGPDKSFGNGTIGKGIHGDIDPGTGMVDEADIDGFKVFLRGVVLPQIPAGKGAGRGRGAPVIDPVLLSPPVPGPGRCVRREDEGKKKEPSQGHGSPSAGE